MTITRVAAAAAAIITALLLQATLIAPVTQPVPISLPAMLVAAIALASGPGTGMSLGFTAGLLADLGSAHPAGALALGWLALGIGCGLVADPRRSRLRQLLLAATCCALAASAVTVLLAALDASGATYWPAVRDLPLTLLGDATLAAGVLPIVRRFLRSPALRLAAGRADG